MTAFSLLKNTNAFKIFLGDKKSNTLSHAYLITCDDRACLETYLKIFAKALMCENGEPCNHCRTCNLIDSKNYTDVVFYPKGKKIVTADIDELVEKSYYKPLESSKKLFVLSDVADMNVQAQNKLLKTLEEPPENTYILMGATTVYPLLSTLLSRAKKLEILPFSETILINALKDTYSDIDRLSLAVRVSGGKLGEAISKYENQDSKSAEELAINALLTLNSSTQIAKFSNLITKDIISDFISALTQITSLSLQIALGACKNDKDVSESVLEISKTVSVGALIYIQDKIRIAEKSLRFNGNLTAVVDGLLFGIVEGKYKWSK